MKRKFLFLLSAILMILPGCQAGEGVGTQILNITPSGFATDTAPRLATLTPRPLTLAPAFTPMLPTDWPSPFAVTESPTYPSAPATLTSRLAATLTATPSASFPPPGEYTIYYFESNDTPDHYLEFASLDGEIRGRLLSLPPARVYLSPYRAEVTIAPLDSTQLPYRLDLQTGVTTPIPSADQSCDDFSWSPDGKQAIATCADPDTEGGQTLYLLSLQDEQRTRLINCETDLCGLTAWSPDGLWIAYLRKTLASGVYSTDGLYLFAARCLNTPGTCDATVNGPYATRLPLFWSPDSRYLASAWHNKTIRVFETGERGLQFSYEIMAGWSIWALAWLPDSEWIVFDMGNGIYKVPAQGGEPIFLNRGPNEDVIGWLCVPWPAQPGAIFTVTPAGDNLNLRDAPALAGTILQKLQPGDTVTILSSPVQADGYTWWQMQAEDGTAGWAVNIPEWYEPVEQEKPG